MEADKVREFLTEAGDISFNNDTEIGFWMKIYAQTLAQRLPNWCAAENADEAVKLLRERWPVVSEP